MALTLSLPDYRLFPYELRLAERELEALKLRVVSRHDAHFVVEGESDTAALARLTYVARVGVNGHSFETEIARFERIHRVGRSRREGRQATRYHLHGIHEYKGKFNPQVVRAFANLVGFESGDVLLDPFCGSGTALVEGLALGGDVVGIDRSPIAALISRAKTETWRAADVRRIARALTAWIEHSASRIERAQQSGRCVRSGLAHLDADSISYLENWFTSGALAALSAALAGVVEIRSRPARLLAQVAVSSIARAVSLQLPEDLRVRRRPPGSEPELVLPTLQASLDNIILGLEELAEFPDRARGAARVIKGTASSEASYSQLRNRTSRVAVITSPPYATALPYIDTDRLSVVLLGLAPAAELRELERILCGSREWTTREHREWSDRLSGTAHALPSDVVALCRHVHETTAETDGFRRRATAGLLYRYFWNMRASFAALRSALKSGEHAVFIVGQNRTRAGDEQITIDTPALLGSTAETVGFNVDEMFGLETWPRFGLHHANGIAQESAVLLSAQ